MSYKNINYYINVSCLVSVTAVGKSCHKYVSVYLFIFIPIFNIVWIPYSEGYYYFVLVPEILDTVTNSTNCQKEKSCYFFFLGVTGSKSVGRSSAPQHCRLSHCMDRACSCGSTPRWVAFDDASWTSLVWKFKIQKATNSKTFRALWKCSKSWLRISVVCTNEQESEKKKKYKIWNTWSLALWLRDIQPV